MEIVPNRGKKLMAEGLLEICQKGEVVDTAAVRGPIRLRLPG